MALSLTFHLQEGTKEESFIAAHLQEQGVASAMCLGRHLAKRAVESTGSWRERGGSGSNGEQAASSAEEAATTETRGKGGTIRPELTWQGGASSFIQLPPPSPPVCRRV